MPRDIVKLSDEKLPRSHQILERARKVLLSPTVTGPFRAPSSVAFVKEARGSRIRDFDGNEYVDVTMAYGPLILGHSPDVVVEAIERACRNGTVYAIANEPEVRLAELMVDAIPCADRVAFMNSGTEATMHAMKIARARTGRDRVSSALPGRQTSRHSSQHARAISRTSGDETRAGTLSSTGRSTSSA